MHRMRNDFRKFSFFSLESFKRDLFYNNRELIPTLEFDRHINMNGYVGQ